MLPLLFLLAVVVSNNAVMTESNQIKSTIEDLCAQDNRTYCGDVNIPLESVGPTDTYYIPIMKCFKGVSIVSEDKKMVAHLLPEDASFNYTVENGCLIPSKSNTGSSLNETNVQRLIYLPLIECESESLSFLVECFNDPGKVYPYLLTPGGTSEKCVGMALDKIGKDYDVWVMQGDYKNVTCQ